MQSQRQPITRNTRTRHLEIVETDRLLAPPRLHDPYLDDRFQFLTHNPDISLDDFIARFASSALEEAPSRPLQKIQPQPLNMSNHHPLKVQKDEEQAERQFWQPFPHYTQDPFTGFPPRPDGSIIMRDNYHLPGNPPVLFPFPYTPDVPRLLALDPVAPRLAEIDKAYHARPHIRMDDVVAEQCMEDDKIEGSQEILQDYTAARIGYVQCVGKRLQAVVGYRNERPVDLPKMGAIGLNKSAGLVEYPQHFYDVFPKYSKEQNEAMAKNVMSQRQKDVEATLNGKGSPKTQYEGQDKTRSSPPAQQENETSYKSPTKIPPPKNAIEHLFRGYYSQVTGERSIAMQRRLTTPPSTRNRPQHVLSPAVNRVTGEGLREFLTKMGQEGIVRKRDCKSITFCDFSPHILTGDFENKLLGHWTASREKGERIEVYELDLRTTHRSPKTGREEPKTQTWIWILISRPVVSLSATDTSTKIITGPPKPAPVHRNAYEAKLAANAALPKTPPTFPSPIPTSWVDFACPLENVTEFPETVENISTNSTRSVTMRPAPSWKTSDFRQDYDFSHAGIPIFEHSSVEFMSRIYPKDHIPQYGTRFLSVENLGGYGAYDYCGHLSNQVYLDKLGDREESPEKFEKNEYDEPREAPHGLQSPKSGIWWEKFIEGVDKDKNTWEDIRSAMGRGKCRVVVRWSETELLRRSVEVDSERFGVRESSADFPPPVKPAAKKGNGKRANETEGAMTRSRKAAKTAAAIKPKRKSQLATEVMTASPGGLAVAVDAEKITKSGSAEKPKRKLRKRG